MSNIETVLITGSSSGIGEALARAYLRSGANVGVCGRDKVRVASVCAGYELTDQLVFDTVDRLAVRDAFEAFHSKHSRVDRIILNAGIHVPTDGASFSLDDYARLMEVNYVGTLNCLEPAIEILKSQAGGQLVLMGSVAGYRGMPGAGGYCASKSAIMRLAETLKVELGEFDIDVRLVSPGFVKTPLTDLNDFPMPFLMDVDDATKRIQKGLDSRRFEISFPRRLAWLLKIFAVLPSHAYFKAAQKMLRDDRAI